MLSKGKQRAYKKFPTNNEDKTVCKWRCYAKKLRGETTIQVISLEDTHTCVRNFNYGRLVSYKWIGRHFGDKIRNNPNITLDAIQELVMKKYKCIVSRTQCRNAKNYALIEGDASIEDHYGLLRSYAKALVESNEGSTIKVGVTVNPDEKTYFDRFYVCFHGLKDGWKLGCRRIIALDGCFLKKPNTGEILTAIGRDGNNHIFPVAWAVVSVENKDNWSWFLELLADDLDLPNGNGLTLMSDQHKGLIEAVKEVMPHAEYRQCARHIYEGFRKQYSGVEFRGLFWAASKASFPQLHNKIMEKIKRASPRAHEYLVKKEPKTWSRAFFNVGVCCEAVENGFSECFNSVLVNVRHKPIITMLESIRVLVMERMNTMRLLMEKWTSDICPNIQKILELSKDQQMFWHVIPCGGNQFEVRKGCDAFKVDEPNTTCSCRMWQLSGLPCSHAIACIFKLNRMVEEYVPECFRKDRYLLAYSQYMKPVDGIDFWPDCSHLSRILGPMPKKMPGRPRKKRVRVAHEPKSSTRIPRTGVVITCHNCGESGHNKKGCKKDPIPSVPKEKGKRGRPKKNSNTDSLDTLVEVNDVPRFVNNDTYEFEKGDSNSKVVFNDGRIIPLVNKKKRGTSHVKLGGGKTKAGRLISAQRLGTMGEWLEMDALRSVTIEEQEILHSSLPPTNHIHTQAYNIAGTQQSQVTGVGVVGTSNEAARRGGFSGRLTKDAAKAR